MENEGKLLTNIQYFGDDYEICDAKAREEIKKIKMSNKIIDIEKEGVMILPQKVYETLRWIIAIVIPALIMLYGVIGKTLDIPKTTEVLIIAEAVDACLGTIFGISKLCYDKVNKVEGGTEH